MTINERKNAMPTILAADVGFRAFGWAIFKNDKPTACGVIQTELPRKKQKVRVADANAQRAAQIARELSDIIDQYDVCAIVGELPHGGSKSAKSSRQMAMATAVVAAVAEIMRLPTEWATPAEVKTAVTGSKTASKRQVIDQVRELFSEAIEIPKAVGKAEHIADACGVYIALKNGNLLKILNKTLKQAA